VGEGEDRELDPESIAKGSVHGNRSSRWRAVSRDELERVLV